MSINYSPLTYENFPLHEGEVMKSEEVFPEEIRETRENYLTVLAHNNSLGFIATVGSDYMGNIVGFTPSGEMREALRLDEIDSDHGHMIYLYNIVTAPEFQAMGYGKMMLAFFMEKAAHAGYKKIGGHFRNNGSLKNFKRLGGEELAVFEDWFGTGESYIYCELSLL